LCECLLAELLESAVYSSIYAQVSGRYLSPLGTAAGVFWITGGFDLKSGAEDAARAARQAGEALQSRESADEPAGATNEEPQQDTAATGGRVARGYKPRSDAAGRQQWVWVGDGTIVTEKPTIIKEAAIELAAARRGTADLGAISACISLCYDFYSPHRALAATCIAEIMAGRPRMAASCDTLAGVLRALAKEKRARAREALVGVLVELAVVGEQDGKVVRALVSMLDDPDRRCRAQAVAAVSALAPRNNAAGALENLLRRLTSEAADGDNVWYAREAALACLAALASAVDEVGAVMGGAGGEGSVWRGLWGALQSACTDDNEYLRAAAIAAVGKCAPPGDAEAMRLAAHMVGDGQAAARSAALAAMDCLAKAAALQRQRSVPALPSHQSSAGLAAPVDDSKLDTELVGLLLRNASSDDADVRVRSVHDRPPPGPLPHTPRHE
jgi:hypothetical protein